MIRLRILQNSEQLLHSESLTMALNILFKLCLTPFFNILYYIGAELFPTNLGFLFENFDIIYNPQIQTKI